MVTMVVQELASMEGHPRRWHVELRREGSDEHLEFTVNLRSEPTLEYMRKTVVAMINVANEEAQKAATAEECNQHDTRIRQLRRFL